MISNERHWPSHLQIRPKRFDSHPRGVRPLSWVGTLADREIQIERKRFHATLKENPSGRFLRVTEVAGERSNTIIIPTSGLRDFSNLLAEMIMAAEQTQPGEKASAAPVESESGTPGEVSPAEGAAPPLNPPAQTPAGKP